jgi:hypothetical protein
LAGCVWSVFLLNVKSVAEDAIGPVFSLTLREKPAVPVYRFNWIPAFTGMTAVV